MRTIFFTIAILFSFSNISAQKSANQDTNTVPASTVKTSKTDFYNAIIKINNFDITIKEDKKEVTNNTKNDFYNLLLEKNGFNTDIRKSTRLTNNMIKTKNSIITKSSQVVNLIP